MANVFACFLQLTKATDQETSSKCDERQEFLYWKECDWYPLMLHKPRSTVSNQNAVI